MSLVTSAPRGSADCVEAVEEELEALCDAIVSTDWEMHLGGPGDSFDGIPSVGERLRKLDCLRCSPFGIFTGDVLELMVSCLRSCNCFSR